MHLDCSSINYSCYCAQTLNVSFLVSFAFCIGASANLPIILYTIYWKKFNSNGAIIAMATGLISCIILGALGPNVWNPEAGKAIFVGTPLVSFSNPAIITVPLGFLAGWLGTVLTQNKANEAKNKKIYNEIHVKANTGILCIGCITLILANTVPIRWVRCFLLG